MAGQCYRNAYRNVRTDPKRFLYCEGFCYDGFWFPHAWFVDRRAPGLALDTTLREGEYRYFGAPIPWRFVSAAALAEGRYGVLEYWEKSYLKRKEKG